MTEWSVCLTTIGSMVYVAANLSTQFSNWFSHFFKNSHKYSQNLHIVTNVIWVAILSALSLNYRQLACIGFNRNTTHETNFNT